MILPHEAVDLPHRPILPEMLRYGQQLVRSCFPGTLQTDTNARLMDWLVLRRYACRQEVAAFAASAEPSEIEASFLESVRTPAGLLGTRSSALPGAAFGESLLERTTLEAYLWFVQASLDLDVHWEDGIRQIGLHAREDGIRYYE